MKTNKYFVFSAGASFIANFGVKTETKNTEKRKFSTPSPIEELKNKYLAEYQVDSLSQLPINFDGIVMQADEEYGNLVWDKHFGNNYSIMQKQKSLYQFSGLLNPFASLQRFVQTWRARKSLLTSRFCSATKTRMLMKSTTHP